MKPRVFRVFIICKAVNSHGILFFYNMFEGRIFECCNHTLSISPLLFGLMRDILRFIFFICRLEKFFFFFTAFVCSLGLLLPDSKFLLAAKLSVWQIVNYYSINQTFWRWAQSKVFATSTPHVELLHFSVLDKVLWVKFFSNFCCKTCSDTGIILRLWLNPFETSVLVCPSQVKISKKNSFPQIFMKSFMQPKFNMENSKIELIFSNFFIFIFIFASISQECHKKWVKKFFSDFHGNCYIT